MGLISRVSSRTYRYGHYSATVTSSAELPKFYCTSESRADSQLFTQYKFFRPEIHALYMHITSVEYQNKPCQLDLRESEVLMFLVIFISIKNRNAISSEQAIRKSLSYAKACCVYLFYRMNVGACFIY